MKFYPQDWRADEKLRMVSLSARGLWIEMLAIMHRSERYGQLLIGGRVPTDAQLAVQVGASPSEVTALLAELDGADVFSRAASGAIYSRRMTRDHKKAKAARENGRNGGNPALKRSDEKERENPASDNGEDKAPVKGGLKPQKPETRNQKELPPPDSAPRPARDGPKPELAEVMQAARMTQIPSDHGLLTGWLADGADLNGDIIPIVERITSEVIGRNARPPFKLKLFDPEIRQKLADDRTAIDMAKRRTERARAELERQEREDAERAAEEARFRRAAG